MIDALAHRRLEPEIMDDPSLHAASHRAALRGLARINTMSRSDAPLWPAIRAALREANRPLRLMDVACGGGDVTLALGARAQREGLPLEVHGCDISDTALEFARKRAAARKLNVAFHQRDVLEQALPGDYDIITCTLFLHHLTGEAAARLLAEMARRAKLVIVSDLQRTQPALIAAWVGVRLLSRSPVVRVDGPRSVRAAFTLEELRKLAARAELQGAEVRQCFPFRMLLTWRQGTRKWANTEQE